MMSPQPMPDAYARRICHPHMPDAYATSICTDGRTDGQTNVVVKTVETVTTVTRTRKDRNIP